MTAGDIVGWSIIRVRGKNTYLDSETGPILSISGESACVKRPNGRQGFISIHKLRPVSQPATATIETGGASHGSKE